MVAAIATAVAMASFVATVLTDRGESVPGASVTLRSTSNTYTATSDASGRVAIANVVRHQMSVTVGDIEQSEQTAICLLHLTDAVHALKDAVHSQRGSLHAAASASGAAKAPERR